MFNLSTLPIPAKRRLALRVKSSAERHLRKEHPWIFDGAVESVSHEGKPGDLAVIFDSKRQFLAIGLYDPTSPIRVRVLQHNKQATIDEKWFASRLKSAFTLRKPLINNATITGYRLVHGENDGLPGFVLDQYADVLVMRLDSVAWVPYLAQLVPILQKQLGPAGIVLRLSRRVAAQEAYLAGLADGTILAGKLPEEPILFRENGFTLEVDPVKGQKTGYFLDQRENRTYVESVAAGRDVLDVFAYHGGFALHAARGGAKSITTIDQSQPAIAVAQRNFRRNEALTGRSASEFETLVGDAFQAMTMLARGGRKFDLVVLDPPSFAQRQADVPGAVHAYRRLVLAGVKLLEPAGILVAASCSSRVPAEDYFELVEETVREVRPGYRILRTSQHALDHPVGFPEGPYLKCISFQF